MNFLDLLLIIFIIASAIRGYQLGLVHQAGSTIGFVVGLFLGGFVASHVITHIGDPLNRSLVSLLIVLSFSFWVVAVGEFAASRLRLKLTRLPVDKLDRGLGSLMGIATLLFGVWLAANILILSPSNGLRQIVKGSRIVAGLDRALPPATQVMGALNRLIDPNGFPQVFEGLEPHPKKYVAPSSLGNLRSAVQAAQTSVVKVEGLGCGGIVEGSGFVITNDEIVTNAHVVAGVRQPQVLDANGAHDTRVVWFDPNVDLAVLRVSDLAGKPLRLDTTAQADGTDSAVLGYPAGGDFSAQPATIIDRFDAIGRNIYGQGTTTREVYSVAAKVVPGNSGGPLIDSDGEVLGIVFATSTAYNDVGYVLTAHQVAGELKQAEKATATVNTSICSE